MLRKELTSFKNPDYPESKPEDFEEHYDPEESPIPFDVHENCFVCGRIASAIHPDLMAQVPYFDNDSSEMIIVKVCSSLCRYALCICSILKF